MELSQEVRVVKGLPAEWGMCYRTVLLDDASRCLSYGNNSIAVGVMHWIIIFDAITGSQTAILLDHTSSVNCLAFSLNGKLLVSGSWDNTVKLWDVQTGGVIKTFWGHHYSVDVVSISADYTIIASGGSDHTIYLWDVKTGMCLHSTKGPIGVSSIVFLPTNPRQFISVAINGIQQWDVNGCKLVLEYTGLCIAFAAGYPHFALCQRDGVIINDFNSGDTVARFSLPGEEPNHCYFSPDDKLLAVHCRTAVHIWDINSSEYWLVNCCCEGKFAFSSPSSLVTCADKSVMFWQIGSSFTNQISTDSKSALSNSPSILSVSLQTRDGIAITSDSKGVVQVWDISTGLLKSCFQIPGSHHTTGNAWLGDGRLLFVWYDNKSIFIWDSDEDEISKTLQAPMPASVRMSGDGTKVFRHTSMTIKAWSTQTWESVGEVDLWGKWAYLDSLYADNSRVWVRSKNLSIKGWDFGASGPSAVLLVNSFSERPRFDFIDGASWGTGPCLIRDTVTGEEVFRLVGRYAKPKCTQWDGQYLAAGYENGEILILDFSCLHFQ